MTDRNEAEALRPHLTGDATSKLIGRWSAPGRCEPHLDELLDDPIMTLLWRGDRLEPRSARATVLGLRDILRRRRAVLEPLEA